MTPTGETPDTARVLEEARIPGESRIFDFDCDAFPTLSAS